MENLITCRPVKPHHLFWKRNCRFTADAGFAADTVLQMQILQTAVTAKQTRDKEFFPHITGETWPDLETWWGLWFYPSVWKSQGILPYFFLSLDCYGGYCQRKLPWVKLHHQLQNLMTISKWKIRISWKTYFNIKERVEPSANKWVAKDLYKFHPLWAIIPYISLIKTFTKELYRNQGHFVYGILVSSAYPSYLGLILLEKVQVVFNSNRYMQSNGSSFPPTLKVH